MHSEAIGVQQHAKQGLGVVGRMSMPIVTVGSVEGCEVELVDHVEVEPGEKEGEIYGQV
jgi:hypothetical protein